MVCIESSRNEESSGAERAESGFVKSWKLMERGKWPTSIKIQILPTCLFVPVSHKNGHYQNLNGPLEIIWQNADSLEE